MELILIFIYFDALEYVFQLNEASHSKTALWPLTLASICLMYPVLFQLLDPFCYRSVTRVCYLWGKNSYTLAMFPLCMTSTSTCLIPLISRDTVITSMFTPFLAICSLAKASQRWALRMELSFDVQVYM